MAITSGNLYYKYTGTAGTTNPETSLGGSISINTIPSGIDNNVFDDVTGSESSLGEQHYRAIGIFNSLATHIWMNTSVRVEGYLRAGANNDVIYIGTEQPIGTFGAPDGTIQIIGSETTAPAAITWLAEGAPSAWTLISGTDYGGSIGGNDWGAIWLQRSIPASAAAYSDRSCTIKVQGETSASPYVYPVSALFKVTWTKDRFSVDRILGDMQSRIL